MPFPTFTSTSAACSCQSGAQSCSRWTSRWVAISACCAERAQHVASSRLRCQLACVVHAVPFCLPLTLQQGIIMFLQSLPTQSWSDRDAEVLLSDAFV
jgi:hypothetical protein